MSDITKKSGIQFKHVNGAFGQKWLPETMGSGLAWIDYDGDGYQDLFLVNSREWTSNERADGHQPPANSAGPPATCKLYHNNKDGTFTDVTELAHLNVSMYGMGVCVGDFDNCGRPDLFITSLTRNYLFHNNGNGTFTDVTDKAGVRGSGWASSAAFVDYDLDGNLDIIVAHYVKWSPAIDQTLWKNVHRTYGTPQRYEGLPPTLYHNNGNGTFTDVSAKAGILKPSHGGKPVGKSLGVAVFDFDNDGWPDIALANDTEPNSLFHNLHNGTFEEVGVKLGMAYPDNGAARGAMGIDSSDYDRSLHESLVIGNFSNQQLALYRNEGANFRDVASQNGIGPPSILSLSFGLFFCDLDNDGWPDIFVANGHVDDDVEESQKRILYAEPPLIFMNQTNGQFRDFSRMMGPDILQKLVARGAAYADTQLTGYPDVAISVNNSNAHLFHNSGGSNLSLRLELIGAKSNKSAIGAVVTVMSGSDSRSYRVRSGSSYCSQSELPITVGLGSNPGPINVKIVWPYKSHPVTVINDLHPGQFYKVHELLGIVSSRPLSSRSTK